MCECVGLCSYLPWFEVFYKLLNLLANYTNKGEVSRNQDVICVYWMMSSYVFEFLSIYTQIF